MNEPINLKESAQDLSKKSWMNYAAVIWLTICAIGFNMECNAPPALKVLAGIGLCFMAYDVMSHIHWMHKALIATAGIVDMAQEQLSND